MEHKRWNEPKINNRPSKLTVPEHAHPVARFIFEQMRKQRITYDEMENCSGVLRCTLKGWRKDNVPGINTSDACLGVLGFSLLPVPNPETLDPELRADLEALADKYDLDSKLNVELVAACVGRRPWTGRKWKAARERLEAAQGHSADAAERRAAAATLRRIERGRGKYQAKREQRTEGLAA